MMKPKALKSARVLVFGVFFMMTMIYSIAGQNQNVDFLDRDASGPSASNVVEGEHKMTDPVGPVEMTVAETLYVMETSVSTPNLCDATVDRVSTVSDIFADATFVGTGTIDYEAKTNATGVLSFSKTDKQFVNVSALQDDLAGKNRSVFMWVKSESDVRSDNQVLLGMNAATGSGNVSNLLIDNTGENLEIYDGGNFQSASFDMGDGKWHYVGYTYNNETTETIVYVDGAKTDRFTNKQEALADTRYSLGQDYDGTTTKSDFFNGDMTEISFWNEVLTPRDIIKAMQARIDNSHSKYANLVGYYSVFGDCSDDTAILKDHSGKGNDGIMQNLTIDFRNVQAIQGFNSLGWYDSWSWKKDGTEVSTAETYTADLVEGSYEFVAARPFIESTDSWSMTGHTTVTSVDNIPDEVLCSNEEDTYGPDLSLVSYLDFEETKGNFIDISSVVDDLAGNSLSVFMWVNKESTVASGDRDMLFAIQQENINDPLMSFYISSSEKLVFYDGTYSQVTSEVISTNDWFHVGFTYDAGTFETKVYVNGQVEKTFNREMPVQTGLLATLGQRYDESGDGPSEFLDGKLAEISIWNTALTEAEVNPLVASPPEMDATNLIAFYGQLQQVVDNRLFDGTANQNTGYPSHSSIIVTDEEVSIPGYDASSHSTFSWSEEGSVVSTGSSLDIIPSEGTTNYDLSYGAPFFRKQENFALTYTELMAMHPADKTEKVAGSVTFSVPEAAGASYQWFENVQGARTIVAGQNGFVNNSRIMEVAVKGDNLYAIAETGLSISRDAGATWETLIGEEMGLNAQETFFGVPKFRTLSLEGDNVYVTLNNAFCMSEDNGATWDAVSSIDEGVSAKNTYTKLFDPDKPISAYSNLYRFLGVEGMAHDGDDLYLGFKASKPSISRDGGKSWENITYGRFADEYPFGGNPMQHFVAEGHRVYGSYKGRLQYSLSKGVFWESASSGDMKLSDEAEINSIFPVGDYVYVGSSEGLSISKNEGDSWKFYEPGGRDNANANIVNSVFVDGGLIYIGTNAGLLISEDGGTSWQTIYSNTNPYLNTINSVIIEGEIIYLGTDGGLTIIEKESPLKDEADNTAANQVQGATSHALTINNLTLDQDQAQYFLVVTKDGCTRVSDVVTLTVVEGPFITEVSPASGASDIAINVPLAITFNDNVSAGTGNIRILEYDTNTEKQSFTVSQASINGAVLSLPAANLDNDTRYYITIDAGIVQDSNSKTNAAVTDKDLYSFTTVEAGSTDVTPPVKPAVTHISEDTGISSTDGITSDPNLFVYGTAEANATVEVFSGANQVGTIQADVNGNWTLDITAFTLTQGSFDVTVEAIDAAGNRSVTSDIFVLTIDFSAPVKPVVTGISDDTGSSDSDGITSDRNLLVHGTAEADATVDIFSGTIKVGTVQADAHGDWTLDITAFNLTQNTSNVTAEAIDAAGNRGLTSDIFVLTIDYTAPVKPIITGISDDTGSSNSDGITRDRNLLVHGTAEANATVEIFSGTIKVGTVQTDANGDWTLDITAFNLTQNTSNVTAEAIDAAGNRGLTSDIFVLTIDYTAPAKPVITGISDDTGSSATDGITSDRKLLIHGTAEANAIVEVFSPGGLIGSVDADVNGDWTLDITAFNLPEMVANTTAEAIDVAGNRSATSDAFVITIDFTAPAKPVITGISDDTGSSATDGITSDRKLLIHGTAEANATVEVFSPGGLIGSATANANGDWTLDITAFNLPEMVANTTAEAIDAAGNRSATSDGFMITIDFTSPAVAISIDNNSVAGYLINANFDEDVSGFDLTDISVTGGTASTLTQLSASSYTFLVNSSGAVADVTVNVNGAEDVAGNANTVSNQLSLGFTPVSAPENFTSLQQTSGELVKVSVYPNPASSWLTIDLSEIASDRVDVAFVNTAGLAVFNHNNFEESKLRVDVSGYKSGMYLVLISTGESVIKRKVLIRK